jgi:hypothetical protein|tara:strand:+ start:70 stop:1074 length:1005 start_codon:yes stop_codon:yes gene_type:complete
MRLIAFSIALIFTLSSYTQKKLSEEPEFYLKKVKDPVQVAYDNLSNEWKGEYKAFSEYDFYKILNEKDPLATKYRYVTDQFIFDFEWNNPSDISDPNNLKKLKGNSKKVSFDLTLDSCRVKSYNYDYKSGRKKSHNITKYHYLKNHISIDFYNSNEKTILYINNKEFKDVIDLNYMYFGQNISYYIPCLYDFPQVYRVEDYKDEILINAIQAFNDKMIFYTYDYKGQLYETEEYAYDNYNNNEGLYTGFYENGNKVNQGLFNDNGAFGEWTYFSRDGLYSLTVINDKGKTYAKSDNGEIKIYKLSDDGSRIYYKSISIEGNRRIKKLIKILNSI